MQIILVHLFSKSCQHPKFAFALIHFFPTQKNQQDLSHDPIQNDNKAFFSFLLWKQIFPALNGKCLLFVAIEKALTQKTQTQWPFTLDFYAPREKEREKRVILRSVSNNREILFCSQSAYGIFYAFNGIHLIFPVCFRFLDAQGFLESPLLNF